MAERLSVPMAERLKCPCGRTHRQPPQPPTKTTLTIPTSITIPEWLRLADQVHTYAQRLHLNGARVDRVLLDEMRLAREAEAQWRRRILGEETD